MAAKGTKRDEEQREAEERSAPAARVVHAAVTEQGEDELGRPVSSLFWSGLGAGIAMTASASASGALHHFLPDTPWREAVTSLGYPLGFLVVILGRLQLFTEQTMVAVLPLARKPSIERAVKVARLWFVVFIANMLGAASGAALATFGHVQSEPVFAGMISVSARLLERGPLDTLMQAVPAGFLIASIAWIRSATEGSGFSIVAAITYGIALCGFAHVIAGAVEAFLLMWHGDATFGWVVGSFLLPALAGNIIGGTGLFALLAHAQVKNEI